MYPSSGHSVGLDRMVQRAMLEIGDDATGHDALLGHYAVKAADTINRIRKYTPTETHPVEPQYESDLVDLVVFSFNKRGAEGQSAHSENGVSRNYESGSAYPTSLLSGITPKASPIRSGE